MPTISPYPILDYVVCGLIGAVVYVLTSKFLWEEREATIRRVLLGGLAGFVVYVLGLPDSITALTAGYLGIDFVEAVINKKAPSEKPAVTANKGATWLHTLGFLAGGIIMCGGVVVILIDFPTGLTDPVGWVLALGGLALAVGSWYLGKPKKEA